MPTTINSLETLLTRVQEVKSEQSLISLLNSMGFFALVDFLKQVQEIISVVSDSEESFVGGLISLIEQLLKPSRAYKKLINKNRPAFTGKKLLSQLS